MKYKKVYDVFYQIPRLGLLRLSDGGGPLGFDITTAIQFDYLIRRYKCDSIFETGCFLGDTTEYLSKMYPQLTIISCDINDDYFKFTRNRLKKSKNVILENTNSPEVIIKYQGQFKTPFFYLDAHWYGYWPLIDEIRSIQKGIVCVDDFNIENERFSFDTYDNQVCDYELILASNHNVKTIYVNNPNCLYPYPCLQIGRRSGKGYFQIGHKTNPFKRSIFFSKLV